MRQESLSILVAVGIDPYDFSHEVRSLDFLPFKEARSFFRKLGLKTTREWEKYRKTKPENIPSHPEREYKNKWKGWGDWLGTGNTHKKDFLSFEEARKFARKLGLKSRMKWGEYSKINRLNNLPSNPSRTYSGRGWISWMDFLGFSK